MRVVKEVTVDVMLLLPACHYYRYGAATELDHAPLSLLLLRRAVPEQRGRVVVLQRVQLCWK